MHSKEKEIRFERKKDNLYEILFEVVWLYQTTYLLVKFKDFEMVELSSVISLDEIQRFFQNGLIIMSDLPRWKNAKIFLNDEKYEDFSKWFYCNGQLAKMENERFSK